MTEFATDARSDCFFLPVILALAAPKRGDNLIRKLSPGGVPVKAPSYKTIGLSFAALVCLAWAILSVAQEIKNSPEIPDKFQWDMQTAARLRPTLVSQSVAASGRYTTGRSVFEKLVDKVPPRGNVKLSWELRITNDDFLNAFASPDGTIYVDRGLAQLAGTSAGLWAGWSALTLPRETNSNAYGRNGMPLPVAIRRLSFSPESREQKRRDPKNGRSGSLCAAKISRGQWK